MNLALFDLDNTLLAGDSDHAWGEFLVSRGIVDGDTHRRRNDEFYQQYKAGTLDIYEFLAFQLAPLAAHPRHQLDAWHAEFMRDVVEPMMPAASRQLVADHLAAGDLCAVVTATNAFVTAPIVRAFGIPHLIATIPAQHDGLHGEFTGQPRGTPSFREGKIVRVEAWLESLGLHWGSFARSWFYSDSHNDLPLMEKVTHPVAVDADERLTAVAQARGWPVRSLRGA